MHFVAYSTSKKHVTQLIPTIVWKQVYINYQIIYLEYILAKKTLKNRLRNTLKDLGFDFQ
jgi:hypothetical protein